MCLIKHNAVKSHGEWRYSPTTLGLITRWRSVVSFTLQPLYPREGAPVPIEWNAVWAPESDWIVQKREKSFLSLELNPGPPPHCYTDCAISALGFRLAGVESNWVHSARRPLIGLLYLPRVIMMMVSLVKWRLAGETVVLGENPTQRHFVHHKSHLTRLGIEPGPRRWEVND
jgi:hypothetical protein